MKLKNIFLMVLLFVLMTTFIGCEYININYKLKYSEITEKTIKSNEITSVNIDNLNGFIKVTTHNKKNIFISAEKFSNKKEYLKEIILHFDNNDGKLNIYSERKRKNMQFKVNYKLLVPEGLKNLEISSTNGSIKANGNLGKVNFLTTNGSVRLNGNFTDADIRTTNGSIKVIQTAILNGDVKLSTTNGSIRLSLNGNSSFKINGRTVNGSISCGFPVNIKRKITSSIMNGEIGEAQHTVSLSTTNGSIKIYKK